MDQDNEFMNIIYILTNTSSTDKERLDIIWNLKKNYEFAFSVNRLNHIFTDLRILLNDAQSKKYISPFRAMLRDALQYHFNFFVAIINFIDSVGHTISFYDYFQYFIGGYYLNHTYCYRLDMCHVSKENENTFIQIIRMLQKYNEFDVMSLPMRDKHKKMIFSSNSQ